MGHELDRVEARRAQQLELTAVFRRDPAGGYVAYDACADCTLAGYLDSRRAAALRRAYTEAC